MPQPFQATLAALRAVLVQFNPEAAAAKQAALARLHRVPLPGGPALAGYHDALLFLSAHPSDAAMQRLALAELRRLAAHLKARRGRHDPALHNLGLPHVATTTRFTHDCVRWLLAHPQLRVSFDGFNEPTLDLGAVLRHTLPPLERLHTQAGLSNDALLAALRVPPARTLPFLVAELARLDARPALKDQLFEALDVWVRLQPTGAAFSKAGNRLPMAGVFHQTDRLRAFDPRELIDRRLPPARALDAAQRGHTVQVLRNTMALTARETDPATYLDERSLRVFDLERGLTVAIFGMSPDRQLALESYLGFTLFKNGWPVAYGGAWMLGGRADFGMNIFEPYRGGESGYMMCQLLRCYRQLFAVRRFEVDAHQFGLDNPDGIASGAFWFYHRHGFRPVDKALAALARREHARLAARPGARSSAATLRRYTGSSVALDFGGPVPPTLATLTERVTRWVARQHGGDRPAAEHAAVARFMAAAPLPKRLNADEQRALATLAPLAAALDVHDAPRLRALAEMVCAKPVDALRYQQALAVILA
jgi:hypothetical protein